MLLKSSLSDLQELTYYNDKGNHVFETQYHDLCQSVNDEPAMIINHGEELRWYHQGLLHREEEFGPAIINKIKKIENYFLGGQLHRKNGPAVITPKLKKWIQYSKMHRADGPASIEDDNGTIRYQWWYKGKIFESFKTWAMENDIDPEIYTLLKLEFG